MAPNQQSKRPATTLRCGNIKATIWQNVSDKGPFFATTFRGRPGSAGPWRNDTSFGLNDQEALLKVALWPCLAALLRVAAFSAICIEALNCFGEKFPDLWGVPLRSKNLGFGLLRKSIAECMGLSGKYEQRRVYDA